MGEKYDSDNFGSLFSLKTRLRVKVRKKLCGLVFCAEKIVRIGLLCGKICADWFFVRKNLCGLVLMRNENVRIWVSAGVELVRVRIVPVKGVISNSDGRGAAIRGYPYVKISDLGPKT